MVWQMISKIFFGDYKSLRGPPFKLGNIGLLFEWYSWFGNMERCIVRIERWTKYNMRLWQWNALENFVNFLWPLEWKISIHVFGYWFFFIGFKKCSFCWVYWNENDSSSPMLMLQNLKDRSLIKWAKDGNFYMHEQLWDMCWNIAMEITMSRFIWNPNISLQKK